MKRDSVCIRRCVECGSVKGFDPRFVGRHATSGITFYGALEVVEGRAEFLHLPTVNLDCNQLFLEHIRSSDPDAHHVVIADQAGFHLREGDERLPEGVHIVPLPPYSPELNPCEQLWDVLKDTEGFANGLFESIEKLRKALHPGLKRFWEDAHAVLSLIGRPWLRSQANATAKS